MNILWAIFKIGSFIVIFGGGIVLFDNFLSGKR